MGKLTRELEESGYELILKSSLACRVWGNVSVEGLLAAPSGMSDYEK